MWSQCIRFQNAWSLILILFTLFDLFLLKLNSSGYSLDVYKLMPHPLVPPAMCAKCKIKKVTKTNREFNSASAEFAFSENAAYLQYMQLNLSQLHINSHTIRTQRLKHVLQLPLLCLHRICASHIKWCDIAWSCWSTLFLPSANLWGWKIKRACRKLPVL